MTKKNIICVGFYDDFARFFLSLIRRLELESADVKVHYFSIYFSGWTYFILRFKMAHFFSIHAYLNLLMKRSFYKQKLIANSEFYRHISLDNVIKYHKTLNPKNTEKLKLLAMSYVDISNNIFDKLNPDLLILSGDSRLSIEVLNLIGKARDIDTLYFEQGPFKTTIIDDCGVNANFSFRKESLIFRKDSFTEEKSKFVTEFLRRRKSSAYKRINIYRGFDYLIQFALLPLRLLPLDITMEKRNKGKDVNYNFLKETDIILNNTFLLILQVPYDANMIYHSQIYNSHLEILVNVFENLPDGITLLVREHPLYKGNYESELYEFMISNDIYLDTGVLGNSLKNAEVIIVNNSTVGIEAIAMNKTVVVLGQAYYDHNDICLKLKCKEDLGKLLKDSLDYTVNQEFKCVFLYELFENFLIEGHFRDAELDYTSKIISNNILKIIDARKNL